MCCGSLSGIPSKGGFGAGAAAVVDALELLCMCMHAGVAEMHTPGGTFAVLQLDFYEGVCC